MSYTGVWLPPLRHLTAGLGQPRTCPLTLLSPDVGGHHVDGFFPKYAKRTAVNDTWHKLSSVFFDWKEEQGQVECS